MEYLSTVHGIEDPKKTITTLYSMYRKIDPNYPYLRVSERDFFPANLNERTMEKYLQIFPTIYTILRDAAERYERDELFRAFWEKCVGYLLKCGYQDLTFMAEGDLFYRQSMKYWRVNFADTPEGLSAMFAWFRSCFGIEGNDNYCRVDLGTEVTYDWNRMKACHNAMWNDFHEKKQIDILFDGTVEWSEDTVQLLHETRNRMRAEIKRDEEEALKLLDEIAEKNKKAGLFQGEQP